MRLSSTMKSFAKDDLESFERTLRRQVLCVGIAPWNDYDRAVPGGMYGCSYTGFYLNRGATQSGIDLSPSKRRFYPLIDVSKLVGEERTRNLNATSNRDLLITLYTSARVGTESPGLRNGIIKFLSNHMGAKLPRPGVWGSDLLDHDLWYFHYQTSQNDWNRPQLLERYFQCLAASKKDRPSMSGSQVYKVVNAVHGMYQASLNCMLRGFVKEERRLPMVEEFEVFRSGPGLSRYEVSRHILEGFPPKDRQELQTIYAAMVNELLVARGQHLSMPELTLYPDADRELDYTVKKLIAAPWSPAVVAKPTNAGPSMEDFRL